MNTPKTALLKKITTSKTGERRFFGIKLCDVKTEFVPVTVLGFGLRVDSAHYGTHWPVLVEHEDGTKCEVDRSQLFLESEEE